MKYRNILITGSNGFIGKNLISILKLKDLNLLEYNKEDSIQTLYDHLEKADFVFHFAGTNRPKNNLDYYEGNRDLTKTIADYLKNKGLKIPILFTSSIQAELDNDYGKSKLEAEKILENLYLDNKNPVYIYRLKNVFGKWSRPNYNSVVATWCYNISRNIPLEISDREQVITLNYIDDVIDEFISLLNVEASGIKHLNVEQEYSLKLGDLKRIIENIEKDRKSYHITKQTDLEKKIYATYLSFLDPLNLSYSLKEHKDDRGSFTELFKMKDFGQVSVNISKKGVTKGNHWHRTKNEKFVVIKGKGIIQLRNIFDHDVLEYKLDDENMKIIDIPPGYTHNIINQENTELITIIWVNEIYDEKDPDTFYLEVADS